MQTALSTSDPSLSTWGTSQPSQRGQDVFWKASQQGASPDKGAKAPTLPSCPRWRQDPSRQLLLSDTCPAGESREGKTTGLHIYYAALS